MSLVVATAVLEIAHEARNYDLLNLSLNTLSKKHGQLKGTVEAMVNKTMSWLEDILAREGTERWLELVHSLRTVTEGKVGIHFMYSNYYMLTWPFPCTAAFPRNTAGAGDPSSFKIS